MINPNPPSRCYHKELTTLLKATLRANKITPKRHKVWSNIEIRQVIESCQAHKGTKREKRDLSFLDKE